MTLEIKQIMDMCPVMAVLVIKNLEYAVPLAQALYQGGLKVLEITLRTPVALEAITLIREHLPGVSTPTEAMKLYEQGYSALKFFPAEAAGGAAMLKAIGGPLPQLHFCPTGGINPNNASDYLAVPSVRCVGGSWMAPDNLIQTQNWPAIEAMAKIAAELKKP